MKLALFDLDRTLLPIDSADDWAHFVVRAGTLAVATRQPVPDAFARTT